MKKYLLSFFIGVIFTTVIVSSAEVFAGKDSFKTALVSAFTSNFDAPTRTRVTSAFVATYPAEWNARVASGTADNPTNRGLFVADKVIGYVEETVKTEERRASLASLPTPTPLPNE